MKEEHLQYRSSYSKSNPSIIFYRPELRNSEILYQVPKDYKDSKLLTMSDFNTRQVAGEKINNGYVSDFYRNKQGEVFLEPDESGF
jgi:hypothetical protein